MTRTAIRTCPLCEATCGLRLHLDGDVVTRVEGDPDDVFSRGYLCPKGAAFGELEADPDRLRRPLVRGDDGVHREVTWDEAFATIERRLVPLLAEHGPAAVAAYLGNPNVHNLSGSFYVKPLLRALRTRNIFSATTVDQMPKHVSSGLLFGDPFAIPVPDIDRTDWMLMLGANPRMSNGSLFTAPDLPARLSALTARGRLVVVDPRRSRTAAKASEHVPIRPGTDVHLLLAMIHTLFAEDLVDLGGLAAHVTGLDDLAEAVAGCDADAAAAVTGVAADTIRRLARELAAAQRGVVYGRIGTTTVRFGTTTSWAVDVLNVLTGHLDTAGGAMFPKPAHVPDRSGRRPFRTGRWHSRVAGHPEVNSELPVAAMAEEILTPGEGRIRCLVTVAGNPVLSTPDGDGLAEALGSLDLMISIDPYLNETTRHADVVLPPPGALERGHYDVAFTALAIRNIANYSPPVVARPDGRPDEWELLLRLAAIALGHGAHADVAAADDLVARQLVESTVSWSGSKVDGRDPEDVMAALEPRRGPERLLDLLLRAGPYGDGFGSDPDGISLATLEERPHGLDLGPLAPRVPEVLTTATGSIELAPGPILADLARVAAAAAHPGAGEGGLLLVGRRHLRTNNSWMHNVPMLAKGRDLCVLQIHPDDAAARGLTAGADACVRSTVGEVRAPVELTEDIMRGVVSLPHGFGHDAAGTRMGIAADRPGVNSNRLTPRDIDPLSGNAVLNGIEVTVGPA